MSRRRPEELDLSDPAAVADFERAFYAAFVGVTGNRLIRSLWRWDDAARRLATRVPYAEQRILVERNARGQVEAAMAVNVAMRRFQGAAFGFSPGPDTAGCCEFLAFFAVAERRLDRRLGFVAGCYGELRRGGLRWAYATTAPRPLGSYLHIGGELLEEREVEGEMRYFLRFPLERPWMRRRTGAGPPAAPDTGRNVSGDGEDRRGE